ncbi:MAG: ABC transporter permease, partial [Gemmatimonadales bacterium]
MNVFLSATSVGLLLALLALGVAISYSVLRTIDLTVDGSFMTGAAIAGMLLIRGVPASLATLGGALGGVGCGLVTGIFQTKFGVPHLLAGMITTTGLYSVNLAIMGGGNLPLAAPVTVFEAVAGSAPMVTAELATAGVLLLLAGMLVVLLRWFFRSSLGLALLAVGDNPTMAEAVAVDTAGMTILGLGISNGLVALSGALFAQYQG